ncbi:hypothetical protein GX645_03560 [Candidatus Sumerlaeota bacterium]|nr:hypothetical protein [Candidatus Sumerlaeales bacterium]NLD61511.1 hypothetical protein [Candidatus Sumerlaeota bacterium]
MKHSVRLALLVLSAGALFTLNGCASSIVHQYIWPEYKCDDPCLTGHPYMYPKRNACGRIVPPPGGPWYFEKGPAKGRAYK